MAGILVLYILINISNGIEDSLRVSKNYNYDQELKQYCFSFAKNNSISWCFGNSLRILNPPGPRTGLFSYPGSGNTWLRYLIQKSTGYVTGCDHVFKKKILVDDFIKNHTIYNNGFPGELISDGSAIVIKSHLTVEGFQFK